MYHHLALPFPWRPATSSTPLLVYGASSANGAFAVKLAQQSNIHPVIAIAGKSSTFVETIIDRTKGDTIIDYRDSPARVIEKINDALIASGNQEIKHVFDAISEPSSVEIVRAAVAPDGHVTFVLPTNLDVSPATGSMTSVAAVHNCQFVGPPHDRVDARELGYIFSKYFTRALQKGTLKGHPYEVRHGGLAGVEQALKDLKDGKANAVKYLLRISDTPGLEK